MVHESYICGEARGQNLAAQLLARGFSRDGDDELLSPSGDCTGVVLSADGLLVGCEGWHDCRGLDDLAAALHEVDGLESADLRCAGQEGEEEGYVFRDGEWYALLIVEEFVLERSRGEAIRAAEAALEPFGPSRSSQPAAFRPYPNPGATVEILQSIGSLHLVRDVSRDGAMHSGVHVVSWDEPQSAAPDPERPGYQVALADAQLPAGILSLLMCRRAPRQRRSTAVFCLVFGEWGTSFNLVPEAAAGLLARFGFDPAPFWSDVEAAGWKKQRVERVVS
jgi:hypothetical protein